MNSGQNQNDTGTEPGTHGCENYITTCQNLIIRHAVIYIVVIEEPQSGDIILAAANVIKLTSLRQKNGSPLISKISREP